MNVGTLLLEEALPPASPALPPGTLKLRRRRAARQPSIEAMKGHNGVARRKELLLAAPPSNWAGVVDKPHPLHISTFPMRFFGRVRSAQ